MFKKTMIYIAKRLGYEIRKKNDVFTSVARLFDMNGELLIFDIGANIGRATMSFTRRFPKAEIIAFEPIKKNSDALEATFNSSTQVEVLKVAVGDQDGEVKINVSSGGATHSVRRRAHTKYGPLVLKQEKLKP
jgi:trans-aconitate methyltransferase